MEDLNDVEFGSDKDTEEAPILIAQRYLNIFRQVHIFNQVKRNQFDDELLALPVNIIELIKSMPGGRLLIEHIEDVKTERGISFVKSKREDFITDDTPAQSGNTGGQATVVQGGIGSVVVDASFAESLANSMAAAFKQIPSSSVSPAVSGDFGKAFELIAQEIHSSRTSLLDILKETRSITNSVIASQVAIAKVLDNLLSSQNKEKADTAILSDKIIASQTALMKMFEKMSTASLPLSKETNSYADIDKKLQDFRNEIKSSVNVSLQSLVERLYENSNKKDEKITDYLNVEHKLQAFKSEIKTDIDGSLNKMQTMLQDYAQAIRSVTTEQGVAELKSFKVKPAEASISEPTISLLQSDDVSDTDMTLDAMYHSNTSYPDEKADTAMGLGDGNFVGENRKKKKKKKKKNSEQSFISERPSFETMSGGATFETALSAQEELEDRTPNIAANEPKDIPAFDGVIHNEAFNHQDDFSNIKLNDTFLDNDALDQMQADPSDEPIINEEDLSVLDRLDMLNDFNFASTDTDKLSDESLVDDKAHTLTDVFSAADKQDYTLPAQDEESNISALDSLENSHELDFALPEQGVSVNEEEPRADEPDMSALDDLVDSDGLDFALPDQGVSVNEEEPHADEPDMSALDDLVDSDGLDFALPDQGVSVNEEEPRADEPDMSALDDLVDSDGLDFALPEQGVSVNEEEPRADEPDMSALDDLVDSDGLDFALPEQGVSVNEEEASADEPDMSALDSFVITDEPDKTQTNPENTFEKEGGLDDLLSGKSVAESQGDDLTSAQDKTSSRYSAELEKIRAALTSDNIDISSLEQPIALDEYSDDENLVEEEEDSSYGALSDKTSLAVSEDGALDNEENNATSADASSNEDDWEWEYVDKNGNEIKADGDEDQDWEWEYVEDDGSDDESDNNRQ